MLTVPPLGAGDERHLGFVWKNPPGGIHLSWVIIDVYDDVHEIDEANNRAGPRIIEIGERDCPEGVLLKGTCMCGEEVVSSGYCCDAKPRTRDCDGTGGGDNGPLGYPDYGPADVTLHQAAHAVSNPPGGCSASW